MYYIMHKLCLHILFHMQGNGSVTVSIDAIFGLCRKRSAGKSIRGPLSGTAVFESQDEVNHFVNTQRRGLFVSTVVVG